MTNPGLLSLQCSTHLPVSTFCVLQAPECTNPTLRTRREQHPSCHSPKVWGSGFPQQSFQAAWEYVTNSSCRDPHAHIAPKRFFYDFQRFQPDSSQKKRSNTNLSRVMVTGAFLGCSGSPWVLFPCGRWGTALNYSKLLLVTQNCS